MAAAARTGQRAPLLTTNTRWITSAPGLSYVDWPLPIDRLPVGCADVAGWGGRA